MRRGALALLVLMAVLATGCSPAHPAGPGALPASIRYVVVAHPDDEFSVWSMVAHDATHYKVFILLTQGEASGFCNGSGLQAQFGEAVPHPQPFPGPHTVGCAQERVGSWNRFLDDMGRTDPGLGEVSYQGAFSAPTTAQFHPPSACSGSGSCTTASAYRLWIGPHSARLVFDLGDGHVSPDGVSWAIQAARSIRRRFPVQAEGDIVGTTYLNTSDSAYFIYDHPDQAAVTKALLSTKQGVPGPQFGVTYPADPRKAALKAVPDTAWCQAVCVSPGPVDPTHNPDARRTGWLQVDYGWLAFSGSYWPAARAPVQSFYSETQAFWRGG